MFPVVCLFLHCGDYFVLCSSHKYDWAIVIADQLANVQIQGVLYCVVDKVGFKKEESLF